MTKDTNAVGVGCPGIYTLDCYCDRADADNHPYMEFPHQYTDELGSRCRTMARKDGWLLDFRLQKFLCPKCNPKSPKFVTK